MLPRLSDMMSSCYNLEKMQFLITIYTVVLLLLMETIGNVGIYETSNLMLLHEIYSDLTLGAKLT